MATRSDAALCLQRCFVIRKGIGKRPEQFGVDRLLLRVDWRSDRFGTGRWKVDIRKHFRVGNRMGVGMNLRRMNVLIRVDVR